jgi:hypothetical protein
MVISRAHSILAAPNLGQGDPRSDMPDRARYMPLRDTKERSGMHVVLVTNDPVRLSFVTSLLRDAGIEATVLDAAMSAVEGSIGAITRRLVVASEDRVHALRVLAEAGEP